MILKQIISGDINLMASSKTRQRKSRVLSKTSVIMSDYATNASGEKNVDTTINLSKINSLLKKFIDERPGIESLILFLKIERGLTLKEIGILLGMSHENVRLYLVKSMNYFKKDLKK